MRKNICRTFLSGSPMLRIWWEYQSVQRKWLMQSFAGPTIAGSEKTGRDLHLDLASSKRMQKTEFTNDWLFIEGSLEVKLPTIWTDEKQRRSRRTEKRSAEERRSEKRKSQQKENAGARKGRKLAKHCVFPMICGSGGSKSRLAKAADAEPSGQMRDEKLHAVVARSTFASQNVQNTPGPEHFLKLRCPKSAHRCGAKHICKWKS